MGPRNGGRCRQVVVSSGLTVLLNYIWPTTDRPQIDAEEEILSSCKTLNLLMLNILKPYNKPNMKRNNFIKHLIILV